MRETARSGSHSDAGVFAPILASAHSLAANRRRPATRREWIDHKRGLRTAISRALGLEPPPPKTPLNFRSYGIADRREFRIQRVSFEARPDFIVTGLIFQPKKAASPAPGAIVFPDYATPAGKSSPEMQEFTGGLCRLGVYVLILDPISAGERKASNLEHIAFGLLPVGLCVAGIAAWAGVRAIDYLTSLKEIDPAAVLLIGFSGGGRDAVLVGAMDDREKLCVAVNALGPVPALVQSLSVQEDPSTLGWLQSLLAVPDIALRGDTADVISTVTRPFLIVNSPRVSSVSREDAAVLAAAVNTNNRLAGWPEAAVRHVECATMAGPETRAAIWSWLADELGVSMDTAVLGVGAQVDPPGSGDLNCFSDGRRLDCAGALLGLARRQSERLVSSRIVPRTRAQFHTLNAQAANELATLIGGLPARPPAAFADERQLSVEGRAVWEAELDAGAGLRTAVQWECPPSGRLQGVALVPVLSEMERQAADEACQTLLSRGAGMVKVFCRPGIGSPDPERRAAVASLAIGWPLIAGQVMDVLGVAQACEAKFGRVPLSLWAWGYGSLVALLAGACGKQFHAVAANRCILTYRALLHENAKPPAAACPYGVLGGLDIAHTAALICPRPLRVSAPVDGAGQLLVRRVAGDEVEWIRAVYRQIGGSRAQFVLAPEAEEPRQSAAWLTSRMRP